MNSGLMGFASAALMAFLAVPLSGQNPIDPSTGQQVEEWLPWKVTRRLLSVSDLNLGEGVEIDYLPGALFEGAEGFVPEESEVVASLRWDTGILLLFDVEGELDELIEELIAQQHAHGFELVVGDDWGIRENPSTFPLEFCSEDGRSVSVSGGADGETESDRDRQPVELALMVREAAGSRTCARGAQLHVGRGSAMPRPTLYAPRGVRARRSGTMTDRGAVTRTHNITALRRDVSDLLAHFALQMEEQGWFGGPPTDFGGAAAQMFTQYADAPDDDSVAGWLALIVLSRVDLETGEVAAQLSVRRVVQNAP